MTFSRLVAALYGRGVTYWTKADGTLGFRAPAGALTPELRAAMRELGMAPLTPHELRHSAATLNLAAGVPLSLVSWFLGHTTPAITQIYLHPMADVQQEAARRFGAYLEGEPPPEPPK